MLCIQTCNFYCWMACLQVPLGVLIKNENKYEDMISIMEHNHQYVPTTTTNMEIEFPVLNEKLKMEKNRVSHSSVWWWSINRQKSKRKPNDPLQLYHINSANKRLTSNSGRLACEALFPRGMSYCLHTYSFILGVSNDLKLSWHMLRNYWQKLTSAGHLEAFVCCQINLRSWNTIPTQKSSSKECGEGT